MDKFFNVSLEFDHSIFHSIISETIALNGKGYVCVVDANVLTIAQKEDLYRRILNESLVNTCDGSSIAVMAGMIYHAKYRALNGPEIFENYVERPFKQVFLGSTEEVVEKIKQKLILNGVETTFIYSFCLPFCDVNEFDYMGIAEELNKLNPDIIWVSLGAPKQEKFMAKLLPYLNKGVMIGIGAAFNFYIGNLNIPRFSVGRLKFIWVNRLIKEPRKLIGRIVPYILSIPVLYFQEKKRRYQKLKESNV